MKKEKTSQEELKELIAGIVKKQLEDFKPEDDEDDDEVIEDDEDDDDEEEVKEEPVKKVKKKLKKVPEVSLEDYEELKKHNEELLTEVENWRKGFNSSNEKPQEKEIKLKDGWGKR